MKKVIILMVVAVVALSTWMVLPAKAGSLADRLKGRILLQVEANGEAWYVNPSDESRYYMGRPADALSLMRSLGIGITNEDLSKIQLADSNLNGVDTDLDGLPDVIEQGLGTNIYSKDSDLDGYSDKTEITNGYSPLSTSTSLIIDNDFASKHVGKIFLQVGSVGEAWYINPLDSKRYYLGRPADAFNIMRSLGMGITNVDLEKIASIGLEESLISGRCELPKDKYGCNPLMNCDVGTVCREGACVDEVEAPDEYGCYPDSICDDGEVCREGLCVDELYASDSYGCLPGSTCEDAKVCRDGLCVDECGFDDLLANDSRGYIDVTSYSTSLKLNQIDNGGEYLASVENGLVDNIYYMIGTCTTGGDLECGSKDTDSKCVNLAGLTTDGYLQTLPINPFFETYSQTGYYLMKLDNKITVGSCTPLTEDFIEIIR
jgi:hypothetical protein